MTDLIDSTHIETQLETRLADLRCRIKSCVDASEYLPLGPGRRSICAMAIRWVTELAAAVDIQHGVWIDPTITDNDGNQIVFEWWHGDKKLISRVGADSVEFIRRWGSRASRQREELILPSETQIIQWWSWFTRDGE
jgi:hypothetical protein